MALIELRDAGKSYLERTFDVSIEKSDCILISGDNGKGKTTLIQLVLGYVQPDKGSVMSKRLKIGYLPEQVRLPLFIKAHLYLETLAKLKQDRLDHRMIHAFGVPILKGIHQLSKGNQQKLALIATFMGRPDLIIMDEPLSGLDEQATQTLIDWIAIRKHEGVSFMISTHKPERFTHLADKHIIL